MPGEVPPTDVPPAAGSFGRFRVLHQIGTGTLGPVFRGEDPDTGERVAIKHLQLKIGPERSRFIAEDLRALMAQLPAHPALTRMIEAGIEGGHPFVVSSLAAGESLDIALREYGPAVLADALPRLERMAEALDLAAQANLWHGALHPRDVMVSARETKICGLGVAMVLQRATVPLEPRAPYAAPELASGAGSAAADRYSFAAVTYEWIFGRAIDGPAETPLGVPDLAGADAERLSDAFTTALAPNPSDRFATCAAFVAAIREAARASPPRRPAAVLPFESEEPAGAATLSPAPGADLMAAPAPLVADLPLETAAPSVPVVEHAAPPPGPSRPIVDPDAAVRWRGSLSAADSIAPAAAATGFSARALAAMLLLGVALGVLGGYLLANARRVPASRAVDVAAAPSTTAAPTPAPAAPPVAKEVTETPIPAASAAPPAAPQPPAARASAPAADAPAAARAVRREAAPPAKETARLLVRTTPPGASVTVDGTLRGKSPLALRDLELGTRTIVVARPGYVSAERRITLTADRPSRSVDVAMVSVTAARPQPTRPAPAAAASGLMVDSRPPGASVTIDGAPRGTTPLTIESLAPGPHTVLIERPGYRPWSTTIDVKAGQRPRVAASLLGGTEK